MKSQEINTMEGEILTEENLPEDEKPKVKNPKEIFASKLQ